MKSGITQFYKILISCFIVMILQTSNVFPASITQWKYTKIVEGTKNTSGILTTIEKNKNVAVSLKQFCYALGCQVLYQWSQYRAVIQNPLEHAGAIISRLTHVALVNGLVVDFEGTIQVDMKEGYWLPIDLATKLATGLKLGIIEARAEHTTPQIVQPPQPPKQTLNTIVIDPGHGGNDLGTTSHGLYEKDIALVYALKLREILKHEIPDVDVFLTREDDRFFSLPDRAKLANMKQADLFVSIHVNHSPNPQTQGVETYILSPEATDDDAKKTALLENDTWLKTSQIPGTTDMVKKILADMEQTKYIQESALFAAYVQQELSTLNQPYGLKNRGVKQALFFVLSQAAMPSVLIEMGFLSSSGDRGRLMNILFRNEFINGLSKAFRRYRDKGIQSGSFYRK